MGLQNVIINLELWANRRTLPVHSSAWQLLDGWYIVAPGHTVVLAPSLYMQES